MDPQFISIETVAKSMIDTKYKQECLKFSFYFLSGGNLCVQYDMETAYLTCMLLDFCTLHLHVAHLFLH